MTSIQTAISSLFADASLYPVATRIWMGTMAVTFLLSIAFIRFRTGARWVLAAFVVNMVGLIAIKTVFPDLLRHEIGTVVHLLFWPIALLMIWRPGNRADHRFHGSVIQRVYVVWLALASTIMTISLIFDTKEILGWVFG